jgi:hypothetical protein
LSIFSTGPNGEENINSMPLPKAWLASTDLISTTVVLGAWLQSTANGNYLRAVPAKLPSHVYSFLDPHFNPWLSVPAGPMEIDQPVLQAAFATYLVKVQIDSTVCKNCSRRLARANFSKLGWQAKVIWRIAFSLYLLF